MIVPFDKQAHLRAVRQLVIELQDYERKLDPRMPSGAAIVDEYVPQMLLRCKQAVGQILVAEIDAEVAGFVTVLTRVSSGEIEDGNIEYGLISDLVVAPDYRRQGLGRELLEAGENFARARNVSSLRIGVLQSNRAATSLYTASGFSVLFSEMEKNLDP